MPMMPLFYPGQSLPGTFPNTQHMPPTDPTQAPTPNHATPTGSSVSADTVDITSWLCYLDNHEKRGRDHGICFSAYAPTFVNNGFYRISQLTSRYVTPEKLVEWLGIDIGRAILILQYLEYDIEAIKAGTLIIPAVDDDGTLGVDSSSQ